MNEMKEDIDEEVDIQRVVQIISERIASDPVIIMEEMEELKEYIEPRPMSRLVDILVAPMGIAVYGIKKEADERYAAFTVVTNAVKGVVDIPPDISASSYQRNGKYYGKAFSVQLNAFVVAVLKNGMMEYYGIQNVVVLDKDRKELNVENNIWDVTDFTSIAPVAEGRGELYPSNHGDFYYYAMPNSIPFGRVELEMRARAKSGKTIVEFYANEEKYDEVTITAQKPVTSAYIVAAPTITYAGYRLSLELILGGRDSNIPYAVLHDGQIGLELYVHEKDKWVPPPSAWSIGIATSERSHACVVPRGIGSVIIEPGEPSLQQLW